MGDTRVTRHAKDTRIFTRKRRGGASRHVGWLPLAMLVAAAAVIAAARGFGDDEPTATSERPAHVHGLGVNPVDDALFIATHTGLYRAGEGDARVVQVGDSRRDTMGFSIAGAKRFLGSGHPDPRDRLPPLLGLIESTDDGRSWDSVSLSGEADFHVLRSAGDRVYGYDSSHDRLLVSKDRGKTWDEAERPAPLIDLVTDPSDNRHLIASGVSDHEGLYESRDGGNTWTRIGDAVGLLAWPVPGRLFLVDGGGNVFLSTNGGVDFGARGSIGGQPAALLGQRAELLYAALHDGTIMRSTDGGLHWTVRATP